jgi:RNA polymerase sigma-70 factor (ECF subfamily)
VAHNLSDALRAFGKAKRDGAHERSREAAVEAPSRRLKAWLAAEQSSPSQQAERHERAVQLAAALEELPDDNREALVLHYCEDGPLADIATHVGRIPAAVADRLKRDLKQLRAGLSSPQSRAQGA